jgi:hypothetical protein
VSQIPYLLSLTRTTPLMLVLAACAACAALERAIVESQGGRALVVLAVPALLLLILFVRWTPALGVLLVFGGLSMAASISVPPARVRKVAAAFGIAAAAGAVLVAMTADRRSVELTPADAGLYRFARAAAPRDALFIVPPGLDGFRFFAQRGVYVDWRLFPTPSPKLLPVWFSRLTQVAGADEALLRTRGWESVPLWDASYARQNTPDRIASLLASSGADYFVSDLSAPGAVRPAPSDVQSAGLEASFANARFTVYHLRNDAQLDGE